MTEVLTEFDKAWNLQYEKLVDLKRQNGHCIVPSRYAQDKSLGVWVCKQRSFHTIGKLRTDRKECLDGIGFVWKIESPADRSSCRFDKKWLQQYQKLVVFHAQNGHCRVTTSYEQDKSLKDWVFHQRINHTKKKIMRQDRKELLDKLNFGWQVDGHVFGDDKKWLEKYERLVEFQRKNGHCLVPQVYEQDRLLGRWVYTQRTYHTQKKMRQDRRNLLDKIGFVWKVANHDPADGTSARVAVDDKKWNDQHEKLVEWRRNNGHCMVPSRYEQDQTLAYWVIKQRATDTMNKLRLDRKDMLDKLGFVWKGQFGHNHNHNHNDKDEIWHQSYEKLVEWKRKNGHCIVPQGYEQDKSLGKWVSRQRNRHGRGDMRQNRKDLLNGLGFVWNAREAARSFTTYQYNVRGLVIGSFHQRLWSGLFSHSPLSLYMLLLCA